jgi:hypothetical protein
MHLEDNVAARKVSSRAGDPEGATFAQIPRSVRAKSARKAEAGVGAAVWGGGAMCNTDLKMRLPI